MTEFVPPICDTIYAVLSISPIKKKIQELIKRTLK